jgi:hypothetical protein
MMITSTGLLSFSAPARRVRIADEGGNVGMSRQSVCKILAVFLTYPSGLLIAGSGGGPIGPTDTERRQAEFSKRELYAQELQVRR